MEVWIFSLVSSFHSVMSFVPPKPIVESFPNRLPENRLGKSHESLQDFQNAIQFEAENSKEYSLVMVTEPETRRILLGLKHRGFGMGMYNSFGGKLDPHETIEQCAARELQEETGIAVSSPKDLNKVALLHFTFDDSKTKMLVHVFRLNVSCGIGTCDRTPYYNIDPSVIRGCEEITPEWFDDWHQIPLDNMFADDSLWLTQLLATSPSEHPFIEGFFHFEPGGQTVNTIRHHYINTRGKSLEKSLFHALHRNDISSPSIKEFKEAYAFANAVKSFFGKQSFDVVIDVAGGHGALAAILMLIMNAHQAVVVDPADISNGAVMKAWGTFLEGKLLNFRYECLRTALPSEINRFLESGVSKSRILVVACHACQHLSHEVLRICCSEFGTAVAVMPCCQKDVSQGGSWKSTSRNLGISFATTMDLLLAGKAMSWSLDYDIRMKTIDDKITPQNRIILCKPKSQSIPSVSLDQVHERLRRAYRKAHQRQASNKALIKIDFSSLFIGIVMGALISVCALRR
jgi:8-oxo-dGTP pyrophosphatase MutT (NUDIX family)